MDCRYQPNSGNGTHIANLYASGRGAYSIFQTLAYDPTSNLLHAIRVDNTATQKMVIESYRWGSGKDLRPVYTSKPTNKIGHQAFAFQYLNGTRYFWTRGGYDIENQRSLYARRFQYDLGADISDVQDFKIFNEEEYNPLGHQNVAISPNYKVAVFSATRLATSSRVIRVYDLAVFTEPGDYTDKYLFEFAIPKPYTFALQGLATDGKYIYTLDGNENYDNFGRVHVFTLDGQEIINDGRMMLGRLDTKALNNTGHYNLFYEHEGLVMLPTSTGYELHVISVAGKLITDSSHADFNKHVNMIHTSNPNPKP